MTNVKNSSLQSIAGKCRVGDKFFQKVERELSVHGRVLTPSEVLQNKEVPRGPGSIVLDEFDSAVLLFLYLKEPSRSRESYIEQLELHAGTRVSKSTISRFFLKKCTFIGGLCRPNLVPFDKFWPENLEKALEYVAFIATIDPRRLKFGDEKHLKGKEVFNRKNRRNPFTGVVPFTIVTPDFTNTYNLTGFCSIDPTTNQSAV